MTAPSIDLLPRYRNDPPEATLCDMSNNPFRTIGRAVSGLIAEDRPAFKRIDASTARYDDGSWLKPRPIG
jgi:hypothetical protein